MKSRASVILTLLCLVAVTGTVVAQESTRGSLVVVVQDPTQAVIPGATVKIVASVQPEMSGETSSRGEALFSNLIPGDYDVTVTSQGFKTTRVEGPAGFATACQRTGGCRAQSDSCDRSRIVVVREESCGQSLQRLAA